MPAQPTHSILAIESEGGIRVADIRAFLAAMENAYNGALLFQRMLDALPRWGRLNFRGLPEVPPVWGFWPLLPMAGRGKKPFRWTRSSISSLVGRDQSLVLQSVRLDSPGEWNFLGNSDSLEVVRKFLNDRHERKKDKNYHESKEGQRQTFENDMLGTSALKARIDIARELGASDEDLAPLKELLLYEPLDELGRFQDRGLITNVTVVEVDDQSEEEK